MAPSFDLAKFGALPQAVRDAIAGPDALEIMEEIEEEFDIALAEPLGRLATGEIRWAGFADALAAQGLAKPRAAIAADVVLRRMLRSVIAQIDSDAAPPLTSFAEVVQQLVSLIPSSTPRQHERIRKAAEVFLRDGRTAEQTREALTRSAKVGGAGLGEDDAQRVLDMLGRVKGAVVFGDALQAGGEGSAQKSPTADALALSPDEEAKMALEASGVERSRAKSAAIAAGVERVIRRTGAKFRSDETERRFRTAVEARLRDVRTDMETLAVFMRPGSHGGLGITEDQARKLLEIVRAEVDAFHGDVAEAQQRIADNAHAKRPPTIVGPKAPDARPSVPAASSVAPAPTTPAIQAIGDRRQATAGGMRGTSLTPDASRLTTVPPSFLKPHPSPLAPPPPPPPIVPTTAVRPPAVSSQPSAGKLIAMPRVGNTQHADPSHSTGRDSRKQQAGSEVTKSHVVTSTPQAREGERMVASPAKPVPSPLLGSQVSLSRIDDIRPASPRLVGPIDELRQLTLADFRKIGATPADAAAKIAEKIDLLMRDSYTKRTEGIRALRMSPLMANYTAVLNAALSGKRKIEHVIAEEIERDRRGMTAAEHTALGGLNQKLRV